MMNINGFNICAAPYLTEMKEVHRKPRKWADDEGGFIPYEEPKALTEAYELISGWESVK